MKEVSAIFSEGLKVGLSPDESLTTQAEYLTRCYNMVPNAYGLEPRKIIEEPEIQFDKERFPFPLLYCLSRFSFIFTSDTIYSCGKDFKVTPLFQHNWSGIPHIADFMDTVVICDENKQFLLTNFVQGDIKGAKFKTCCNFRGQLIIGNCSLPNGEYVESCDKSKPTSVIPVGGENIVAWSKIGSIDWEFNHGNEVGWAPMPWQGKVLALKPLGKEIVVYGSNGVAKLVPQKDPVPTYGVGEFGDIGLLNRNCLAGGLNNHLFISTDYNLYFIEPERALSAEGKAPKKIGYKHFMQQLNDPIITFDPTYSQWWIGDRERCFVYTGQALSEVNVTPTWLNRLDGRLLGFVYPHGSINAVIETSALNLGSRGIKTLMNIEVDAESTSILHGTCSWKSDYQKNFKINKRIRLDPRGAFFPVLSGTEFKVKIEAEDFRNFALTKMWLHYKTTDKTFARGVINAGRPAEQGDS